MPEEGFQQLDEKHVANEIELMVWSPKIDLIALANVLGEVILHRLSWQKVWTLQPSIEEDKVGGLAWRPDGKVLAVGYQSGKIQLTNTENASILHSTDINGRITSLSWINQEFPDDSPWSSEPYPEDNTKDNLPKLPTLDKSYGAISKDNHEESVEDSKRLTDQTELNLLLVGTDNDQLHLFAYGVFPCGIINFSITDGSKVRHIESACISQDLHRLSIIVQCTLDTSEDIDYYMLSYDTTLLASKHREVRLMALKYGQIATLLEYLQTTIQQMSEAWEDILMEMDSKLMKFAEEKEKLGKEMGTVCNDFLELLLFGVPSWELKAFLLHELTEKGLKKLGHSIENSYSNIQKLVVKHLQIVSQAIVYHLDEFRGMSLWFEKFGILGLDTTSLQQAVKTAGSFMLKTSELQQVIDGSIKNFEAFFKWLYVAILRLSDEKPPAEFNKMTQHDINFVADFLNENFAQFSQDDSIQEDDKRDKFRLEKVGQYLKKEDLTLPPDTSSNMWKQFLNANNFQNDSKVIYEVKKRKSLVQLQEELEEMCNTALTKPANVIGEALQCSTTHYLFNLNREERSRLPIFRQYTDNETRHLYMVFTNNTLPCHIFYILRQSTNNNSVNKGVEIAGISIGCLSSECPDSSIDSNSANSHLILDISYYDKKTLSLLLVEDVEDGRPVLVQLPFTVIKDINFTPFTTPENITKNSIDVGPLIPKYSYRHLENMQAHSFAVSGTRKTATVLYSSRRRVRIFMLDGEEEDSEDDDDEEEEIEDGEDGNTESNIEASNTNQQTSTSTPMDEDENKENTSL